MNLLDNKLETLLAVNKFKSFTAASNFLHLTQPAVSQHISQLEKEFNIIIFIKNTNTLLLTREGEILVKYARRLKALSNTLNAKLNEEKSSPKQIKIGITHSLEGNIIPDVFAEIASKSNRTTIKIYSDDIKTLYDKLSNYELDLAITEGKITSKKFTKILLDTDYVMVIMPKNHRLADKPVITIEDIQKEKLILRHSRSATRTLFAANLESLNLTLDDFNVLLEIDNASTIKNLVKKGVGISVLPKSICINEIKNKVLVAKPIKDLNMTAEINLLYNENFNDLELLKDIIDTYENLSH